MHKYLPARNRRSVYTLSSDHKLKKFWEREGGVNGLRPRVVCDTCNNTWMSAIETKAKAALVPLMAAEPFLLTSEDQRAIARWAILKSLVIDGTNENGFVYSREQCSKFMRGDDPMNVWTVSIARCGAETWRTRIIREQFRTSTNIINHSVKGVLQSTTVGLNELLIYVVANTNYMIPFAMRNLIQIWPIGNAISWPPTQILSQTQADEISTDVFHLGGQRPPAVAGHANNPPPWHLSARWSLEGGWQRCRTGKLRQSTARPNGET
jgi:hypothetical protein